MNVKVTQEIVKYIGQIIYNMVHKSLIYLDITVQQDSSISSHTMTFQCA